MVMSLIYETKKRPYAGEVEIVLHDSLFDDLDLAQLSSLVR